MFSRKLKFSFSNQKIITLVLFFKYSETCLNRTPFGLKLLLGIDRLNSLKFTILGLNLMFNLHRISFYSGFSLHRISVYSGFSLHRILVYSGFSLHRISVYSGFSLHRISVYSGCGLGRFHCINYNFFYHLGHFFRQISQIQIIRTCNFIKWVWFQIL